MRLSGLRNNGGIRYYTTIPGLYNDSKHQTLLKFDILFLLEKIKKKTLNFRLHARMQDRDNKVWGFPKDTFMIYRLNIFFLSADTFVFPCAD